MGITADELFLIGPKNPDNGPYTVIVDSCLCGDLGSQDFCAGTLMAPDTIPDSVLLVSEDGTIEIKRELIRHVFYSLSLSLDETAISATHKAFLAGFGPSVGNNIAGITLRAFQHVTHAPNPAAKSQYKPRFRSPEHRYAIPAAPLRPMMVSGNTWTRFSLNIIATCTYPVVDVMITDMIVLDAIFPGIL